MDVPGVLEGLAVSNVLPVQLITNPCVCVGNFIATNVGQLVNACGASSHLVPRLVTLYATGNMIVSLEIDLLARIHTLTCPSVSA